MAVIKRTDFKDPIFLVKGNKFGKPDLYQVKVGEHTLMVKDVRGKSFFFRWTLGLWLIRNEWEDLFPSRRNSRDPAGRRTD